MVQILWRVGDQDGPHRGGYLHDVRGEGTGEAAHHVAQRHDQLLPQPRVHALLVAGTERLHKRGQEVGQDGEEERLGGVRVHVCHSENEVAQDTEDVYHSCACPDSVHLDVLGSGKLKMKTQPNEEGVVYCSNTQPQTPHLAPYKDLQQLGEDYGGHKRHLLICHIMTKLLCSDHFHPKREGDKN